MEQTRIRKGRVGVIQIQRLPLFNERQQARKREREEEEEGEKELSGEVK